MERILLIGGNGSGKTTLSEKLSQKLGLPLVHLDKLYWGENWRPAADEVFDGLLLRELVKPRWIIDGNITRTLPLRLQYCDAVVFLDFSRTACLCGVVKRFLQNYGKSRPDMGGGCTERLSAEKLRFFKSVWTSHGRLRGRLRAMLGQSGVRNVIVLKNRAQAERFLREV